MLTEKQRGQPITAQDLADSYVFILFEVMKALAPNQKIGSEMLESIANELLETGQKMTAEPVRSVILATAQNLIESETGYLDK